MTTNQDRAAEVLGKWHGGAVWDTGNPNDLAQALADAGLLAPELPEPTLSDYYQPEWNVFDTTIWTQNGMVYCRDVDTEWEASPADVIAFAHALLAATHYATQEKK